MLTHRAQAAMDATYALPCVDQGMVMSRIAARAVAPLAPRPHSNIDAGMDSPTEWNDSLHPLIGALQRGHYLLYCQSIEKLAGRRDERPFQEILIRFLEEERRLLPPGMFFPILREQGLMALLDCWVVSQVLKLQQVGLSGRPGFVVPRTSINLSEASIKDPEFATFVVAQLNKWNPAADTLCFEILASDALELDRSFEELVAALATRGCGFAIGSMGGDDRSLELLERVPVGYAKIDGRLVRQLLGDPASRASIERIHARCRELGVLTVAEMVEDIPTKDMLRGMGIDYAQGFGISEPAPFLGG